MSPIETKRITAIKVADALNSIEGVPVSAFERTFLQRGQKAKLQAQI